MAMTAVADPVFLDTNVLVYATWTAAPLHLQAQAAITSRESAGIPLVVSRQVLREYLATLNRPSTGIRVTTLTNEVRHFIARFRILEENDAVTNTLLGLLEQGAGRRVYDTNIVATMLVAGIRHLLTNNPGDFAAFGQLITVIPLL
jgi:predicted nucleic acid-binding protein